MISSHTEREIASCKTATHIPATIIQMEGNDIQTWVSKDSINKLDFEKEKKEKKRILKKRLWTYSDITFCTICLQTMKIFL